MATLEFLDGFEYGVLSSAGGGIANTIVGTIGTQIAIETSIVRTGGYSLKIAPSAGVASQFKKTITTRNQYSGRVYFRIGSFPASATSQILQMELTSGLDPAFYLTTTALQLVHSGGTVVATSGTLTTGVWYRLDWSFNVTTNPWAVKASIDGVEFANAGPALAGSTVINLQFGRSSVDQACTVYFDDCLITTAAADYPLGPGEIMALRPDADGTHVNPGSFTNDAGQAIGGAGGSAFQYLDEDPWTTNRTDYVTQTVAGSTDELRVTFPDSRADGIINGVRAWYALDSSGTQAFAGGVADIYSSTTVTNVAPSGDWSNNIWEAYAANVTPNSSPWTRAQLDAIEGEIGHATAQPANPRWDGLIVQYDFTPRVPKTSPYPQLLAH